tara:strand:- start:4275 stop:4448 length:174 start_codon:yes stop_codon:yes gene_type:complete
MFRSTSLVWHPISSTTDKQLQEAFFIQLLFCDFTKMIVALAVNVINWRRILTDVLTT